MVKLKDATVIQRGSESDIQTRYANVVSHAQKLQAAIRDRLELLLRKFYPSSSA